MSDEQHSPGPWRRDDKRLVDANGRDVAWGYVDTDYDDDLPTAINFRSDADARLIAAAPEMLALLREAVTVVDGIQSDGLREDVRALLARITAPSAR